MPIDLLDKAFMRKISLLDEIGKAVVMQYIDTAIEVGSRPGRPSLSRTRDHHDASPRCEGARPPEPMNPTSPSLALG